MGNIVKPQFADTWQKTLVIWLWTNENNIKADQQNLPTN